MHCAVQVIMHLSLYGVTSGLQHVKTPPDAISYYYYTICSSKVVLYSAECVCLKTLLFLRCD